LEKQWKAHVDDCSACTTELQEWNRMRMSLRRPHLQSAPEWMLRSVEALCHPAPQSAPCAPKVALRQIIADMVFDSFQQPAFAGARGQAAARQVVLRAEEFDIHVRISDNNDTRQLMGQIQPRSSDTFIDTARLHLLQNGERVGSADVNDLGEFQFQFV